MYVLLQSGDPVHFRNLQDPYVAGIQNSVYSEISPNQSPQIPPGKANNDLTSRNNILAQPNSIKVRNSKMYASNIIELCMKLIINSCES